MLVTCVEAQFGLQTANLWFSRSAIDYKLEDLSSNLIIHYSCEIFDKSLSLCGLLLSHL